eukprot:427730-Amphidinium_carterae.1
MVSNLAHPAKEAPLPGLPMPPGPIQDPNVAKRCTTWSKPLVQTLNSMSQCGSFCWWCKVELQAAGLLQDGQRMMALYQNPDLALNFTQQQALEYEQTKAGDETGTASEIMQLHVFVAFESRRECWNGLEFHPLCPSRCFLRADKQGNNSQRANILIALLVP